MSGSGNFAADAFAGCRVVITGASRDFGRTLAIQFARGGAEVFLSARRREDAERTRDEIVRAGHERVHALQCDLRHPEQVRAFADALAAKTDHIDILINNGSKWLEGETLDSVEDGEIMDTMLSGGTGMVMAVKHLLALLRKSSRPDIVNMVSVCGLPGFEGSGAHSAFYAMKHAQAGFADILGKRLRGEGIRVISLYPPDFNNGDPLDESWDRTSRAAGEMLTAQSLVDCIGFALQQPRDCFIKAFHFEPLSQ